MFCGRKKDIPVIAEGEEGHPRFFEDVSDSLEQLDHVLEYLRDNGGTPKPRSNMGKYISATITLGEHGQRRLDFILQQLEDDKLATHVNNPIVYTITPKGLNFDGYQAGKRLRNQVEKNESRQRITSYLIAFLTAVIAVGTFVAAWYYLTELCEYYSWTYCFCR